MAAKQIAVRARSRRLQKGWSRQTLSQRSGVTVASIKRFERTGRVDLERLLKLAVVLEAREGWNVLFREADISALTMRDLEAQQQRPRQRGRTQRP